MARTQWFSSGDAIVSSRGVDAVVSFIALIPVLLLWVLSYRDGLWTSIPLPPDVLLLSASRGVVGFGLRGNLPPELRDMPADSLIPDLAIPLGIPVILLAILPAMRIWKLRRERWLFIVNSVVVMAVIAAYFVSGVGTVIVHSEVAQTIAPITAGLLLSSMVITLIALSAFHRSLAATRLATGFYFIIACFVLLMLTAVGVVMVVEQSHVYNETAEMINAATLLVGVGSYFLFVGICSREWGRTILGRNEPPLCRACRYNLTGTLAAGRTECPECGAPIPPPTTSS